MSIAFDAMLGWDEGIRSQIICLANFLDPASVGDVRHPASGLANCRLAVLTPYTLEACHNFKSQKIFTKKKHPREVSIFSW